MRAADISWTDGVHVLVVYFFLCRLSDLPLMLSHHLLLFEVLVKVVSLQLVSWAACQLSREYTKAVLEVAKDCLTIAESFYASRAIVPTRV